MIRWAKYFSKFVDYCNKPYSDSCDQNNSTFFNIIVVFNKKNNWPYTKSRYSLLSVESKIVICGWEVYADNMFVCPTKPNKSVLDSSDNKMYFV